MRGSILPVLLCVASVGVAILPALAAENEAAADAKTEKESGDSIIIRVTGTLAKGVVAIGGETTGATITANKIAWELDFGDNAKLKAAAEKLNGKRAMVKGNLERREGVETKERLIIHVEKMKPAK